MRFDTNWFYTDDMQICRRIKNDIYEFAEFTQADTNVFCFSQGKINLYYWKNDNGEWNNEAISIINSYYKSLEELRFNIDDCLSITEKYDFENQMVAEMIFEQTSLLDMEMKAMTLSEAENYLENIVCGGE